MQTLMDDATCTFGIPTGVLMKIVSNRVEISVILVRMSCEAISHKGLKR